MYEVLNNKKKSVDNLQLYTEHLCETVSMMVRMGLNKELIALIILRGGDLNLQTCLLLDLNLEMEFFILCWLFI